MPKKVYITCAHCNEVQEAVEKSDGIPGVPASYIAAGENQHLNRVKHKNTMTMMKALGIKNVESATGRLKEFGHGKEHNA